MPRRGWVLHGQVQHRMRKPGRLMHRPTRPPCRRTPRPRQGGGPAAPGLRLAAAKGLRAAAGPLARRPGAAAATGAEGGAAPLQAAPVPAAPVLAAPVLAAPVLAAREEMPTRAPLVLVEAGQRGAAARDRTSDAARRASVPAAWPSGSAPTAQTRAGCGAAGRRPPAPAREAREATPARWERRSPLAARRSNGARRARPRACASCECSGR